MRFTIAFIIGRLVRPPLSPLVFSYRLPQSSNALLKWVFVAWLLWPRCICVRFTLEWPHKMKSERDREGWIEDGKVGIEQRGERDWGKGKEATTPTYLSHETMWHITEHFRCRQCIAKFVFASESKHKGGRVPRYSVMFISNSFED